MSETSLPRINPYLILIIGIIGTSFAAIFIRLSSAPFLVIGFYRLLFTVIILSPVFIKLRAWKQIHLLKKKVIVIMVGAGIMLAVHFSLWIASLDFTSIASAVILVDTSAIFAAVLAYLILKEALGWQRVLGIFIAFAGVVIIALTDAGGNITLFGDVLALLGAIACGFYLIAGRYVRKEVSLITYVFLLYISCTITLFCICLFWGFPFYPYDLTNILLFIALAVVSTIFGHTLWNWSLKYVDAAIVGVMILAEPIGSIFFGWLIIGEIPHYLVIVGGVFVLGGIYLTTRIRQKKKNQLFLNRDFID